MDEEADLSLRAQMYKELAQYMAPKRKAVEMQAEGQLSLVDMIRAIEQRRDQAQTTQSWHHSRGRIALAPTWTHDLSLIRRTPF